MHLLAATPGQIDDGTTAVDLGQSPGDIVVLSAADSEIAMLAAAQRELLANGSPSLRLANLGRLKHNFSVDLYVDAVVSKARLVIVRLLGGRGYWSYGVDRIVATCREARIPVALLPGDDHPDAELASLSSLKAETSHRLWQYLVHGGAANATEFLRAAAAAIGRSVEAREPTALPRAETYQLLRPTPASPPPHPSPVEGDGVGRSAPVFSPPPLRGRVRVGGESQETIGTTAIIFYRALVQAGDTAPIDALVEALAHVGVNALPIYVASLKDPEAAVTVRTLLGDAKSDIVLNATGFALAADGDDGGSDPLAVCDCPILQVVLSSEGESQWRGGTRGLAPRDLAMSVVLPEIDGRVMSRAIAFKDKIARDDATEADIVGYRPVPDRVAFVAQLTAAWIKLRRAAPQDRRVALVLANYPNRDGRIGNGVGLDTPESVVEILQALDEAGYRIDGAPADGAALMTRLLAGPTNAIGDKHREATESLSFADYSAFFATLPRAVQDQVTDRWGAPTADPSYRAGALDCGSFRIAALRYGNTVVAVQPARGYNIDPATSYHDPALVPPHGYFAFHAWLRESFRAHAVVHVGKHGNLEWLPGKALALSQDCFPEAALGPVPHLYPFIVNDPGEGTQAKRRASAVVIDHLTPPLTRAGSYGPQAALERLIDEYYEAATLDPRRVATLGREIQALAADSRIAVDCGISENDDTATVLRKLDGFLCELKDMQIRDGLHVFGRSPTGPRRRDLLVAIARSPRGRGEGADASLIRALAADLALGFDPLDFDPAAPWHGPRPTALAAISDAPWRIAGDTIDRLELLAAALVDGGVEPQPVWTRTVAVLDWIAARLTPAIAACGAREIAGLLAGLDGRRVAPGPSGAPTRGRPDVLPTGRNFYSVDTRAVPTPAAWQLGWKAATLLLERYVQDHGENPKALALSAWGTSAMRTGGDDVAQALALIGARPTWDNGSRRVTGFEILPLSLLDRPRVDVTLRVSGFFRDAFPGLIDLFDSAVRAVAALDEPVDLNPLAAQARADTVALGGTSTARRRAESRVFGSKPGAYGAGLQALIDERGWTTRDDLARAYIAWGGYRYGGGADGEAAHGLFESRLRRAQAVVHNQDNREHDLLDSDDYYQFEGGIAAAIETLSGAAPPAYHGDHSRPDAPRVRALTEEIARVVRARAANPKWIAGVMHHGYKGASEIAATVDYLFAFAATTNAVADHQFDALYDAYLNNPAVRDFIAAANPAALREIAQRFIEAQERGLWRPRLNSAHERLAALVRRPEPVPT